ncbi:hypothetical protein F4776DRAFT_670288 [Hypoxylon sp. NC0597]|nr:hypothetical protein F4776DRAFT_670288 [Hypoxylon sp. NC0597]
MSFPGIPPGTDLCQLPLVMPSSPGQTIDFTKTDLKAIFIGVTIPTTFVATVFVLARLYTNIRKPQWSDLLVTIGLLANIGAQISLTMSKSIAMVGAFDSSRPPNFAFSDTQYFRHGWHLPLCWINGHYQQAIYIWSILANVSLPCSKLATLLLYLQIFTVSRGMRIAIYIGMAAVTALYVTAIITTTYFVVPHAGETWDSVIAKAATGHFFSQYWGVASASAALVIDLFLFILPLPILLKLNLSSRRKVQISGVFSVGLLAVVAGIISLVFRVFSINGSPQGSDSSYTAAVVTILLLIDMNASLVIPCSTAFAKFTRDKVLQSEFFAAFKLSFKTEDSKLAPSGGHSDPNRNRTKSNERFNQRRKVLGKNNSGYIEMSDTWLMNSNATVDIEADAAGQTTTTAAGRDGLGVVKTVIVERSPAEIV